MLEYCEILIKLVVEEFSLLVNTVLPISLFLLVITWRLHTVRNDHVDYHYFRTSFSDSIYDIFRSSFYPMVGMNGNILL